MMEQLATKMMISGYPADFRRGVLESAVKCYEAQLAEVEFVTAVTAGGSVKFLPAVLMSPFSLIVCVFFLPKLLKLGEIYGVKFLA